MAYGSEVGVKADVGSKGLASADRGGGGRKADSSSPFKRAKEEEKKIVKDTIITPKGDPNPPPVGTSPVGTPPVAPPPVAVPAAMTAMAVAPDDFGDGFDDGAGGDDQMANGLDGGAKPITRKMTPAYLRGNVAGRMFRRHYYAGNK